jgi:P27 family predicted phage terminase small subunit
MGLRGPAPKPTAIKRQEGNPGKRRLNEREPEFAQGVNECPAHLGKEARKVWERLAPMLDEAGLLTEGDAIALGNLCQAYATLQKAQAQLDKTGLLMKTPSGYVQQSPLVGIVNSAMQTITTLCREFGLTPAARSRITAAEPSAPVANRGPQKIADPVEAALCELPVQ